jgi:hypothetical protein
MPPAFDSRLVGSVSAVSDNTRHRSSPQPVSNITNSIKKSTTSTTQSDSLAISLPLSTPVINADTSSLPIIPEDNDLTSPLSSEPFSNIIDPSLVPHPNLSPKQVQDILQKITSHLEIHGQITPELLRLLDQDLPSTKNITSTTPVNRPTLLSSDKI